MSSITKKLNSKYEEAHLIETKARSLYQSASELSKKINKKYEDLIEEEEYFNKIANEKMKVLEEKEAIVEKFLKEKSLGLPWLERKIIQFEEHFALKQADYLENKKRPAITSAQILRETSKQKREFKEKFNVAKNIISYYETLFPWLTEYLGANLDELLQIIDSKKDESNDEQDPVLSYMTESEYQQLSSAERNQKALDRYLNSKNKSNWQIGRDFERYIGYSYEQRGYDVYYQGIMEGMEDLGRDLICKKGRVGRSSTV
ncbi:MAG: hypothetical protein IPJ74_14435 [Saprospiraceae bacterium]|nr:hypothetical protein [Saprospiraceae bacterium]